MGGYQIPGAQQMGMSPGLSMNPALAAQMAAQSAQQQQQQAKVGAGQLQQLPAGGAAAPGLGVQGAYVGCACVCGHTLPPTRPAINAPSKDDACAACMQQHDAFKTSARTTNAACTRGIVARHG